MMELFDGAKLETSADTRAKAVKALGFDEPAVEQKLNRADYGSDEEYFHTCAELSMRNNSPEYRAEYTRIRREYNAHKAEEEAAAAEQKRQYELTQKIKACVLRPEEQQRVDDEARSRAQADLAAGRISFQQLGDAVTRYAETLTSEAKSLKVHTDDLNAQIRRAMMQATSRKR